MRHVSRLPRAPAAPRGNTAVRGNTPASWAAWRPRLAWLAAWAAVVPVALTRASSLAEPDTFWEIRTGQLILRTGHIPAADSFSWWARGRPWTPNSWAFDVLLALCYRAGGLTFVALAGSGLVLGVAAAVLLLARGLGARPAAAGVLVTAAMAGMFGWLSVRPQLVDFAALPLLLLLGAGSRTPRVRTLLAIAAIEAGWVNLHAAAPLGAVVLLGAGIGGQAGTVLSTGRRALPGAAVRVLAPALAALAGTFANPRGVGVLSQVGTVSGSSAGLITEWEHVSLSSPGQVAMLGTGLLAALVAARRRGVSGRLRAHRASAGRPPAATERRPDMSAALAVLAAGGCYAIRLLPVLDAVAVAVLAASLAGPGQRAWAARHRVLLRIAAAAAAAALAAQAAAGLPHLGRTVYPRGSVAALPSGCRLFNSYALGGIVILLRPAIPVSLDSRNDLYGRRDVLAQQRILASRSGGPAALGRLGVTCALIPAGSGLARQLERSPAWRRLTRAPAGSAFALRRQRGVRGGLGPRGTDSEGR